MFVIQFSKEFGSYNEEPDSVWLKSVLSGHSFDGNKISTAAEAEPDWYNWSTISFLAEKRTLDARCLAFSYVQFEADQSVSTAETQSGKAKKTVLNNNTTKTSVEKNFSW